MLLSDFDYDLPLELIAQEPAPERTGSRLLVVDRSTNRLTHHRFVDILQLLPSDCLLVLNDTRVFPARLRGHKETGGAVEVLLLRRAKGEGETWEVLCKSGQNIRTRSRVQFSPELSGVWQEAPRAGRGIVQFLYRGDFFSQLERVGEVPLPPYIKRTTSQSEEDRERYQTVYAQQIGAVAAPTAGLHFTDELLSVLRRRGVETAFVTLPHLIAG